MKKITFLAAFLLLGMLSNISLAQWTQVGYMITNGTDTAGIDHGFNAFDNDLYCGTIDGLFRSSDNGDNWQNITDGKANVDGHEFYAAFQASNHDLFAGSAKRLFKSTDNGSTWTWLNTLPDSATWFDVTEIGGNLLASFSKGSASGVYYSANGGTSWTLATGFTSVPRYFLVDGTDVLVGGGANGIYKSTDNGQSWTIAGTGIPAMAGIWRVIKSSGAYFANSVTGKGLFVSRDNCATWANTDTTVFHGFCQVFSITESGGRILATMDGACNNSDPLKSSIDIGVSWAKYMDSLPTAYYAAVGRNASGSAFFTKRGGLGKKIYRYDLGATQVGDPQDAQVRIYPNPTSDKFTITCEGINLANNELIIYDLLGKEVHRTLLQANSTTIETAHWPRGIYTYRITQEGNPKKSGKLVVE